MAAHIPGHSSVPLPGQHGGGAGAARAGKGPADFSTRQQIKASNFRKLNHFREEVWKGFQDWKVSMESAVYRPVKAPVGGGGPSRPPPVKGVVRGPQMLSEDHISYVVEEDHRAQDHRAGERPQGRGGQGRGAGGGGGGRAVGGGGQEERQEVGSVGGRGGSVLPDAGAVVAGGDLHGGEGGRRGGGGDGAVPERIARKADEEIAVLMGESGKKPVPSVTK